MPAGRFRGGTFRRFLRDECGGYLVTAGLAMPALTGLAALGTEAGLWMYEHRNLQSAADSGALTAAIAHYREGAAANLPLNAGSVLSSYGLADGQGGTSLTVNHPPQTGTQTGNSNAVEVNISQTRSRLLSAVLSSQPLVLSARAVAVGNGGKGCVLALNPTAGGSGRGRDAHC